MRTTSTQALILGAAIGLVFSVLPSSCGKQGVPVRCNASNCDGCCDDSAQCFKGTSTEACGSAGASCSVCSTGQQCTKLDPNAEFGGRCAVAGSGGGGGTTGGGSGGGGTGGGTTGGGSGGGGGSMDGGSCNPTSCANGCCTAAGVCITTTTPSRCGTGGGMCMSCTMGNTCVAGACAPCAGCIDINTGACQGGMTLTQCGKNGGFCQACDTNAGQTCNNGTCFGGTSCNASTCTGCCDGNNCLMPGSFTNAQCGQGAAGAACVTCLQGATCDAADAGACVGGGATGGGAGGGGGFPFPDGGGGTFDVCALAGLPCGANKCCQPITAAFSSSGSSCVPDGADCDLGFSGVCNGATSTCE